MSKQKEKDQIKKTDAAVAAVLAASVSILSTTIVINAIEVSEQQTEMRK